MNSEDQPLTANVSPSKRFSIVWIIPVVALLIGLWMVFYTWSNQGPVITIQFENADGLEIDTTKLKLRNITIGKITNLSLSKNLDGVTVTAQMEKQTETLLKQDTKFWVVKPRIGAGGITGFGTILSGHYIEISPGTSAINTTSFKGLELPPVTPIGTPGLHVTLNSDDVFAFSVGDPVIYKGLTVGKFEDVFFNVDERVVYYNVFIKSPYHQLVTENTRFWNVSGVKLDLKADGITVQTGNIETLLTNGVTFGVPDGMPLGDKVAERDFFKIYSSYEQANAARYRQSIDYVILVSNSIRGLNVGAPVEYRGINIGSVVSTNIYVTDHSMLMDEGVKIPVLIKLQPGRLGLPDNKVGLDSLDAQTLHWIKSGLKASLKTGNLLTGNLFIELQHYPDSSIAEIETYKKYAVIPTLEDDFSQITRKASEFMDNLNQLELGKISDSANQLMSELTQTANELKLASKNLTLLLENANQQALPAQLKQTLEQVGQMMQGFSEGSPNYDEITQSLKMIQTTLQDLKPVFKQLNEQPNSLIFVNDPKDQLEPKKSTNTEQNQ